MPEISDQDFANFQRLQSQNVAMELNLAKANFRAAHPHIPQALIDAFQGSPEQIEQFGQALLAQFPTPQPPQPQPSGGQPAPVAPTVEPAQPNQQSVAPPNPAVTAQQPEPQPVRPPHPASQMPTSTTPPIMAQNLSPVPMSPLQQQQMYAQQMGAVQPYAGGMQPVPQPGMAAQVSQQNARDAQTQQIRERMASGVATRAEVEWISQWGTRGFVAAMQNHASDVRSVTGGRGG